MLIGKLQLNFNRSVLYNGKQYTYDVVLQDNVQILANHGQNKADVLQFCVPSVKIGRNDTIDMRGAILRMTPEECKKLGINKSKLWYMQKSLREGKKIKIARNPGTVVPAGHMISMTEGIFRHTERLMLIMAELLRRGRPAGDTIKIYPGKAGDVSGGYRYP